MGIHFVNVKIGRMGSSYSPALCGRTERVVIGFLIHPSLHYLPVLLNIRSLPVLFSSSTIPDHGLEHGRKSQYNPS